MRLSGRRLLLALLALAALTVAVLLAVLLRQEERPRVEVEAGAHAPALAGSAVRGGHVSLARLRGHVVLVSFLNSRAEATPEGDPSRAQIVFLRSMQTQHERFGLRVIVVDAAELVAAIAVLRDDGTLARRFGVKQAPTTFLIGPDGVVHERWDGFAPAAQLDLSIRRLEGRTPTD